MDSKGINQYLQQANFHPSKKMGQNFLSNEQTAQSIIDHIDFSAHDVILEVGPGLGSLTQFLLFKNKPVIAVELDKRLYAQLNKTFKHNPLLTLINDDILKIDLVHLMKSYKKPIIVSNLPYAISSPMLSLFLTTPIFTTFYCMLQKELVDRISGVVGSKNYNAFSVTMQTYTAIDRLMIVNAHNFIPKPEVDSVVVKISKNELVYNAGFNKFLKLCFASRRRTLVNNLKNVYDLTILDNWFRANNVTSLTRAEALTPQQLMSIYKILS